MKRFLLLFSIFLSLAASAQKQRKDNFWNDLNDFMNMREDKAYAKLDSNYIGRYPYHWDARTFYTSTGLNIINEGENTFSLSTGMNHRVGVGISYRGLGLSYSFALGKKLNFNFSVDSYSKHFCIEYALRFTGGLNGFMLEKDGKPQNIDKLYLGESRLNLFWSFNPRFSYAAAMKQSKIQRRSAGSFIASVSWSAWDVLTLSEEDEIPLIIDNPVTSLIYNLMSSNMLYNRISVGGGYGYNLVLGHQHWLLHGSLVPMWTVYESTLTFKDGERNYIAYPNGYIAMSATARAGVYYRWGEQWSLGLSGVLNQMVSRTHFSSEAEGFRGFRGKDWYIRLSLAFRFGSR